MYSVILYQLPKSRSVTLIHCLHCIFHIIPLEHRLNALALPSYGKHMAIQHFLELTFYPYP